MVAAGFFEKEKQMSTQNAGNAVNTVETPNQEPVMKLRRPPVPVERLEKLKAERVQELLKALPGWKLGHQGKAIDRKRDFDTPQGAACYAAFVAGLAMEAGQPVNLHLCDGRVVVTLPGRATGASYDDLTLEILGFAQQIG